MRRPSLAIAIQGASLRVLLSDGKRVRQWAEVPFNPAFLRGGFVADGQGISQVIRNTMTAKGMRRGPVVAAFPGFHSIVRVIRVPRSRDVRPRDVLPREARRLMAYSEQEQYLFWQQASVQGTAQSFVVVMVPKAPLQAFVETLKLAGLSPVRMELAPLCLAKMLPQGQAIIANVESDGIDIVIVVDSLPNVTRSIWLGDDPLTLDSAPSRLAEEMANTISFYNDANPERRLPPTLPVQLAGGFLVADLAPMVARDTGHPVTPFVPPLEAPNDFPVSSMVVNAGLVMGR